MTLDPEYIGDHILALMVRLETLLFHAYGGKNEYEIPAMQDEKLFTQLVCKLESLQAKLDTDLTRPAILRLVYSRQRIKQTLQKIIDRIRLQHAHKEVPRLIC